MDLSKEYIEMCSKAEEIQVLGKMSKKKNIKKFNYEDFYIDEVGDYHVIKTGIWIPKQDQLQNLVMERYTDTGLFGITCDIYDFTKDALYYNDGSTLRFKTLEQLWLGFVMRLNYDKYWDKGEWRERYEGY